MSEQDNTRKWYKSPIGVIGTIFIGAIGSGLWEIFLRDALIRTYYAVGSAIGSVSTSFLDDLHEDIGKAYTNEAGTIFFLAFIVLIIALNFLGTRFVLRTYRKIKERDFSSDRRPPSILRLKTMAAVMAVMAIFNTLAYSHLAFSTLYRLKAITWTERSIEIVRPSILDAEFLKLRAQYRSVASAKDFYKLVTNIKSFANGAKIELPEFTAIGQPEG